GKSLVIGQGLHPDYDSELVCIDTATGTVKWLIDCPLHIESSPLEQHQRKLRDTQSDLGDMAWDLALTVQRNREAYLEELEAFLAGEMPDQKLSWEVTTPKGTAGKWPITLSVAGGQTVTVSAVLGEGYAPQPKEDLVAKPCFHPGLSCTLQYMLSLCLP
ncbi:MAG: hypothetical protein HQ567_06390, partial [Candidatus Nealsonbacteria bacterium]|nr:hypothetical protein [Candidatus Nealsonbacteria bacterium]